MSLRFEITGIRERLHELHQRAGMANAVENLATPFVMPDLDVSFEEVHGGNKGWVASRFAPKSSLI